MLEMLSGRTDGFVNQVTILAIKISIRLPDKELGGSTSSVY